MHAMREQAETIFRRHGGQLRMSQALDCGMTRHTLYSMLEKGIIERVSRGIYRLADLPPIGNPDLVTVCLRYPKAVVCLISALAFHDLTTEIPHRVSIAVSRNARIPALDYPPIQVYRFSAKAYSVGIDAHIIDGASIKVYSPEKTLADCFKFRNKIGMDVVLEALKLYRSRGRFDAGKLMEHASVCRVDKIMRPYLEASL
jgi:predicted transcriptional regulator of viral defense system